MSSGSFRTPSSPSGSFPPEGISSGRFRAAGVTERYRVLVVDDDPVVLLSLQSVLSDDVDLMTCESAERALELLQAHPFHVVVSDFLLPGMNGYDLFRVVRGLPEYTSCL